MNKKRTFAVLTALIMVAIGVVTFSACKSDHSINPVPTINHIKTAPIASKSMLTGEFHYNISTDDLQKEISSFYDNKNNNIIIESIDIVEADTTNYSKYGLRFTFIDTEEETATTVLLYNDFISIEISNDSIYYYMNNDVVDGNYSFTYYSNNDKYLFIIENNELTGISIINDSLACYASNKWVVTCTGHNCNVGTCVPLDQSVALGCSPCHIVDEQHWCETSISGGGNDFPWWTVISIAVTLLSMVV